MAMGFLIHLVVAILVPMIGVCLGYDEYDSYQTEAPKGLVCGPNMECVAKEICINGTIDIAGGYLIKNRFDMCGPGDVCCRLPPADVKESPKQPVAKGCGFRNEKGVEREFRGSVEVDHSEFGEFPWMLLLLSNNLKKLYGGASLIHPKIALTAAHVVHGIRTYKLLARAGEWDTTQETETLPHQDRAVAEIVKHADFNNATLRFDIALLFLRSPFELTPHINTVCLPPANSREGGVDCFASGWGIYASGNQPPDMLKKISLDVVQNRSCQRMLRRTFLGQFFRLHDSFMCAGGVENEDTCDGDGGSPLVCPIPAKDGRYFQVGIVSWGLQNTCGAKNIPGVYSNVKYLRSWVDRKVAEKGFDSSTYTAV